MNPLFDNEKALAEMLAANLLFCSSADYLYNGEMVGHTVVLFLPCSDTFAWGCADAEDIPEDQIEVLYKRWKADPKWGDLKWCCSRRNEKPQAPVVEMMKEAGAWDAEMEALPENHYDKALRERSQE